MPPWNLFSPWRSVRMNLVKAVLKINQDSVSSLLLSSSCQQHPHHHRLCDTLLQFAHLFLMELRITSHSLWVQWSWPQGNWINFCSSSSAILASRLEYWSEIVNSICRPARHRHYGIFRVDTHIGSTCIILKIINCPPPPQKSHPYGPIYLINMGIREVLKAASSTY